MRFELDLVRSAPRETDDADIAPRARATAPSRKTVREISDALIFNGLLIDDLPALVRTCCATMLAVAEVVDRHDVEPQVEHFIDAARGLVEHARTVMDRGLLMTNWPQAQVGAVMLELCVRGACAALSVPYDEVMREVHRASQTGELADVQGILVAAGRMKADEGASHEAANDS